MIKHVNRLIVLTLMFGFVFIMFSAFDTVSADSSVIYVNDSGGNDDWDGQYAEWISGLMGPKKSIKNATGTVTTGGTINIADGNYTGVKNTNITIDRNMTIKGQSKNGTIINGNNSGRIFLIQNGINVTIQNLTITNGTANYGGAIYNNGILTINGCIFKSNTANNDNGGAIYNNGILTITDSIFTGNIANHSCGGAIFNYGNLTVNNSVFNNNLGNYAAGAIYNENGNLIVNNTIFTSNNANSGPAGAIYNEDKLTVNNSTFISNRAINYGGAIYNEYNSAINGSTFVNNTAPDGGAIYATSTLITGGTLIVHFSKIVGNTPHDVYGESGLVDIEYNWWGSNTGPSTGRVVGAAVSRWLVLTVTVNPISISTGGVSTITADLLYDNQGNYHDPMLGHIPDGLLVNFNTNLGTISSPSSTVNGIAESNLNGGSTSGVAKVAVTVDSQSVNRSVYVDVTPPIITPPPVSVAPANGLSNGNIDVVLSSESDATIYYRLNGGSWSTFTGSGTVVISEVGVTTLEFYAKDEEGNPSAHTTYSYTIDKTEPIVTVTPSYVYLSKDSVSVDISSESDAKIYYRLNGGSWNTFTSRGTVSISNLGVNNIEVYAVDAAGNPSLHVTYSYTIDKTKPTVTANRSSGTYNTRTITLSAKDNLNLNPVIYYSVNNGVTWYHQAKTAILNLNQGKTVLKFYAKDAAGNQCTTQTITYNIDTIAPKVTANSPKNGAAGVSRTSTISIRLSENILKSSNWSKIYIKNLKTRAKCKITAWISGNHLYIKTNSKKASYTSYQVYIPGSAVKDSAGNNLAAAYTFKFKTGKY